MSEEKTYSKIEDKINDILSDEAQKNAFDFVIFMRANEI